MSEAYRRLAPCIQDFIYRSGWTDLRSSQSAAIEAILDTDENLLLATGTASGKTEAAFMPVITRLLEKPSESVGVLYISPLKALINDQFERLNNLLAEADIPVCKWHGDASASRKEALLGSPKGVLQITPESLESLMIHKQRACASMFFDLRFVIIDEVHAFMSSPRGVQTLCLLERLQRLTSACPRRIGLSATLGDVRPAEAWLCSGTPRGCVTPVSQDAAKRIRIAVRRYETSGGDPAEAAALGEYDDPHLAKYYYDLYTATLGKKSIIFARSRAEVERTIVNLREIAARQGTPDIYRVHHGSVSKSLRERAERDMKLSDGAMATGATVTLELGIDIGRLDQVVQIGAPTSASSFVQRIGRCGRCGQRAELLFVMREQWDELCASQRPSIDLFDWQMIKTISIIQLYITKKWVEPPEAQQLPYALLYQQTLAHLMTVGEASARSLAQALLTLSPFARISAEDYQLLLRHMIEIDHLARTESGALMIGRAAEAIVANYQFCSVFESAAEYDVQFQGASIGSVTGAAMVGARIALAGKIWECVRVNEARKLIQVIKADGGGSAQWNNQARINTHDRIMAEMRETLRGESLYMYLDDSSRARLIEMRDDARELGLLESNLIMFSSGQYALFPWVGTKKLYTIALALQLFGVETSVMPGGFEPVYLEIRTRKSATELAALVRAIQSRPIDLNALALTEEHQVPMKYNEYIPQELLWKQYCADALCADIANTQQ
ncbi:MAG: DEAD/DEAH box helicase [Oscillospiraceae bacterium]|jgi:ATP-dependent Lhr-like helicase|nr:DEAD/DEAH box helicase [Oscillospiraceae bacterium]